MKRHRIDGIGEVFLVTGRIVEAVQEPPDRIGGDPRTRIRFEVELDDGTRRWETSLANADITIGSELDVVVLPSRALIYASSRTHGVIQAYDPPPGRAKPKRIAEPGCAWVFVIIGFFLVVLMAKVTLDAFGARGEEDGTEVAIVLAAMTGALGFCLYLSIKELRRDPEGELAAERQARAVAGNAALAKLVAQERSG
jgi:hypothetical protein